MAERGCTLAERGATLAPARAGRAYAPSAGALRGRAVAALRHAVLIGVVALIGLPFAWMLATSIKSPRDVYLLPPTWLAWPPHLENYRNAWEAAPFGRYLLNSLIATGGALALQAITVSTAAYAFSQIRFRFREAIFLLFLAAMIVPPQVTLVPNFLTLSALGWVDSYWALVMPWGASAFGTFLLRQAFLGVPADLPEAARMDGASHLEILIWIMLPLARSTLLTFLLLSFTWRWNDYLWPLVMTKSTELRTLSIGLVIMRGAAGYAQWHLIMAATLLALLPTLLLFVATQRQFVEGIARSGVRG